MNAEEKSKMVKLTPDEKFHLLKQLDSIIKERVSEIELHKNPSPATIKMIDDLNTKINNHSKSSELRHREIMGILKPIAETYNGISFLGKWGKQSIIVISIIIGVVASFIAIIKSYHH